jgi:hypothetical protein
MKEQTPITAERELRRIGLTHDHVSEVLKWHNAKVLEALEKVTGQIKHLPMSDLPKHLFAEVIHDIGMEATK